MSVNSFLAIDFETANHHYYSACAVGLVKVVNNIIVNTEKYLIRPPEEYFHWKHKSIHHIKWEHVKDQPDFRHLWKIIKPQFEEANFLVAHNANFDRNVLIQCCDYYNITPPSKEFICTVQLSKNLWNLRNADLESVCDHFKISLNHHEPLSDAIACAKIMIKAIKEKKYSYEFT